MRDISLGEAHTVPGNAVRVFSKSVDEREAGRFSRVECSEELMGLLSSWTLKGWEIKYQAQDSREQAPNPRSFHGRQGAWQTLRDEIWACLWVGPERREDVCRDGQRTDSIFLPSY